MQLTDNLPRNLKIDLHWCVDKLQKANKITEKDANLILTTNKTREQLLWHPLQWIAYFNLVDQSHPEFKLSLNRLCQWLANTAHIPYFVIDR